MAYLMTCEDLFTDTNADIVAKEIIDRIGEPDTRLDYDFHLVKGTFISGKVNTWIKFDTRKGTLLKDILMIISDEKTDATKERIQLFDNFRKVVYNKIETTYRDDLCKKIRKYVFANKLGSDILPLKFIKVVDMEISDVPVGSGNTLTVEKNAVVGATAKPVSAEIYKVIEEIEYSNPGIDQLSVVAKVNDYVAEQKKNGNELFSEVKGVRFNKSAYEVEVDLYIDYAILKD